MRKIKIFILLFIYYLCINSVYADNAIKYNPMDEYNTTSLLIGEKKYDLAIKKYKAIIEKSPHFFRAYKAMVKVYIYKKQINSGIIYLEKLKNINPKNPTIYYGLGYAYNRAKKYDMAIECFKKMIKLTYKVDDFDDSYKWFIDSYIKKGKKNRGVFEAELYLKKMLKEDPKKIRVYTSLGYLYRRLNKWEKAHFYLDRAFKLQPELWTIYSIKSSIYYYTSEFQKVLECLNILLREAEKINDIKLQGAVIGNIGIIHRNLRNYEMALKTSKKGLKIFRKTGDMEWEQRYLTTIGNTYLNLGDYENSLIYHNKALFLSRKTGTKKSEGINLGNIGNVYYTLGVYKKALMYLNDSLLICRELGDKFGIGVKLENIARIHHRLKDYTKALNYSNQALNIQKEVGNKKHVGVILGNIGLIYSSLGKYGKALKYFKNANSINSEIGNKKAKGHVLTYKAKTFFALKKYNKSAQDYKEALRIGERIKEPSIIWDALKGLASIKIYKKQYIDALNDLKKAIKIIESARGKLSAQDQKSSFLASKIHFYEEIVSLLFKLHDIYPSRGYDKEFLFYVEKAKARAFLDTLQEAKIDLKKDLSNEFKYEELRLRKKISKLERKLLKPDLIEQDRKNHIISLNKLEDQYQNLFQRIKKENSQYSNLIYQKPRKLNIIRAKLISPETAILEYFITEKKIFLIFITSEHFSVYKLKNSHIILERISNYIELLANKNRKHFLGIKAGFKLYNDLLGPVKKKLLSIKKLIIISDGILHYLPFESLIHQSIDKESRYLIENYHISYAPSASSLINILSQKGKRVDKRGFLAFADPVYPNNRISISKYDENNNIRDFLKNGNSNFCRLPYSKEEVIKISKLFPKNKKNIFLRNEAKEETLKKTNLFDYNVIHFAMHGFLNDKKPSRSSLVFTLDRDTKEDGFLQVREIYNLRLNADLVVLSACKTGKGKLEKGEGVTGLYRAFLNIGARSVLMSLWNINDKATSEFMESFYKSLMSGSNKEQALQNTKIKMIKSEYSHPFYWAAFVLNGESTTSIK